MHKFTFTVMFNDITLVMCILVKNILNIETMYHNISSKEATILQYSGCLQKVMVFNRRFAKLMIITFIVVLLILSCIEITKPAMITEVNNPSS